MTPIEGVLDKYGVVYNDRPGNQKVLCPFHEDHVASASVHLTKGLFCCYACGVAGDAISLLMEQEGLDFVAAKRLAEELAEQSGAAVSRESERGDSYLPSKQGSRPGRRNWVSPWARKRT